MTDHALEVRQGLTDPVAFCSKLGWLEGSTRQSRGLLVRCPSHGDRTPSCSVTEAPDGFLRIKCFSCGFAGDALAGIAIAHGLSTSTDFREILAIGAELSGNLGLADEIRGESTSETINARPRLASPAVSTKPAPQYPDRLELGALWKSCGDPASDGEVVRMLMQRRIDFEAISELRLARLITPNTKLPNWARYRGPKRTTSASWRDTGHRLLLPAWDHRGQMRSVRAWRVIESEDPKRLPPSGRRSNELVQANRMAVLMLRSRVIPKTVFLVEGEPDFAIAATRFGKDDAVIGIGCGAWTDNFAKAIHPKTEVIVATHADRAGDKYADQIIESLGNRCPTFRWRMTA